MTDIDYDADAPARRQDQRSTMPEYDDDRTRAIEANMLADGVSTHEAVQVDYFAFDEIRDYVLPDGKSIIQLKVLTEGDRRKYLNATNRDVRFQKSSGDAIMRMSPGDEKAALLMASIFGWNLLKDGRQVPCNESSKRQFVDRADPKIIDLIDKEIKKLNPWLLAELSIEDIDKEIASLEDMRRTKLDEEAGKAAS